ncbi:MAG: PaaI family thioesterase [Alcaligenaceae bacterium]|nr:PaaI family thioesterase [Alcaligenaceae bacterium]
MIPLMTKSVDPCFSNADQESLYSFLHHPQKVNRLASNPMAIALGTEFLSVDADKGSITLAFEPEPLFIQGTGVLQGGAQSAMLDFAMAFATLLALPVGYSCSTTNLITAFLRPAPKGRYLATGLVEKQGKQLVFTRAALVREENGCVVATGSSTLAVMQPDLGRR